MTTCIIFDNVVITILNQLPNWFDGRCNIRQQIKHQDRNIPFPYIVVLLRSKIAQAIIPNYIYETLMHSIRKGSISFLPKEKLGELVRLLDMLLSAYDSGKSTWAILFDELGDYFDKKFGAPMGTVEWICRRIDQQK